MAAICVRGSPAPFATTVSCQRAPAPRTESSCQADESAVATVSKTKELKKRHGMYARRESLTRIVTIVTSVWKPRVPSERLSCQRVGLGA